MASGGTSGSKQSSNPWKGQQPYLKQLYSRANDLYESGDYEYGPSRHVGFSGDSMNAFSAARGQAGDMRMRGANKDLTEQTMRGDFLSPDSNPYLRNYARHATRDYYGGVNALGSSMESAGRAGGGSHGRGAARTEENLAMGLGDMYHQNYQFERGMQGQAQQNAFQLGEEDWRNINAMRSVGEQQEQNQQSYIQDLVDRFNQEQYGASEKLAEFSSMLGQPVMSSKGSSSSQNWGALSCWVAAVYFGWFTESWFAARRYVMEIGPEWFRDWYIQNGQDLARKLREDEDLRAEWEPVFQIFAAAGAE